MKADNKIEITVSDAYMNARLYFGAANSARKLNTLFITQLNEGVDLENIAI